MNATHAIPAGGRVRVLAVFLALGLLTPLVIARMLSPAPAGIGTHQQLGLPPCSMTVLFDMRCPACGMTTSWSYWTRGQWFASARANVGGACLALITVLVAMLAARVAWTDRWPRTATMNRIGWSIIAVGAITIVDWLVRLANH